MSLREFPCENGCGWKLYPGLASSQQEVQRWHNRGDCSKLNAVGATEEQWNAWIQAYKTYEAANPEPKHKPSEVCTCRDVPQLAAADFGGHCAARQPIVPWKPQRTSQ